MVLESNRDLVLRRLVECLSRDRTKHQVAEVTSLGLVQMTRKKLGLGLLETFSEPCEVCAGRGIIIHHEPVTRHRSSGNESGGNSNGNGNGNGGGNNRRGRGRGGAQTQTAPPKSPNGGTHAITEDVRNALATIAKKTVHHDAPESTPDVAAAASSRRSATPAEGRARPSPPQRPRSRSWTSR